VVPREELEHERVELIRLLHVGDVRSLRDHCPARAGNSVRELARRPQNLGLVELADDHEGGTSDLGQARRGRRLEWSVWAGIGNGELNVEGASLHLPHAPPDVRIDLVRLPRRAVDPRAQVQLDRTSDVFRLHQPLLLGERPLDLIRPLEIAQSRPDEHESVDPGRMLERELERYPAAVGGADQARSVDPQVVEQVVQVADRRERAAMELAVSEAAQVVPDDAVAAADEGFDLGLPHPAVGDTFVEEHDRRTLTIDVVCQVELAAPPRTSHSDSVRLLRHIF